MGEDRGEGAENCFSPYPSPLPQGERELGSELLKLTSLILREMIREFGFGY